ncbi:hypothetical protein ACS0TY_001946 [Phlomoides rotata]
METAGSMTTSPWGHRFTPASTLAPTSVGLSTASTTMQSGKLRWAERRRYSGKMQIKISWQNRAESLHNISARFWMFTFHIIMMHTSQNV